MYIRIVVRYQNRKFKIKVSRETTVGMLMIKIRKFLKLKPEEACFLFWSRRFMSDVLYPGSKLLSDIQTEPLQILECSLLRENTFGTLSKMFVKCRIEKKKDLFCAIITYSWYGLYHFDEVTIHETIEMATAYLLRERCSGHLSLDVGEKK